MNKAWAEKHNVMLPQDYNGKQETYVVRNANGTGPFVLKTYEQDQAPSADRESELVGQERQRHRQSDRGRLHRHQLIATRLRRWRRTRSILSSIHRFRTSLESNVIKYIEIGGDQRYWHAVSGLRSVAQRTAILGHQGTQSVQGRSRAARRSITRSMWTRSSRRCCAGRPLRSARMFRRWSTAICPTRVNVCVTTRLRRGALLKEAAIPTAFEVALDCVNVTFAQPCARQSRRCWRKLESAFRFSHRRVQSSEADASYNEFFRIRLDARHRPAGNVEQRHPLTTARVAARSTAAATRTRSSMR